MQRSGSCRVPKSENQQEIHQYCNRVESATRQGCCPSCPKGWGHSQGDRCLFGEGLRWKGGTWRGKMTLILIPAVIRGTLSSLQGTSNSFLLHLLLENLPCVYKSLSKDPRRRRVVGGGLISSLQNLWEVTKKTDPGSSQWCMAGGQEAMGTLKSERLKLDQMKPFSSCKQSVIGTSCPVRLCSFQL